MDKEFIRIMREISKELRGIRKELKIMNHPKNEEELIHDQDEAVEFIHKLKYGPLFNDEVAISETKDFIREVLEAEEDYMRSKGIIED